MTILDVIFSEALDLIRPLLVAAFDAGKREAEAEIPNRITDMHKDTIVEVGDTIKLYEAPYGFATITQIQSQDGVVHWARPYLIYTNPFNYLIGLEHGTLHLSDMRNYRVWKR